MANVLVTGGAGFIGSHLASAMADRGHKVRVLDDFSSGHRGNLAHILQPVEVLEGDMRDPAVCDRACAGVEFVFHEAAIPSVPKSVDEPEASHDANMNGTFNVLRSALACKVRRVIYAASSSAYGDTEESMKHEGIRPDPLSPYAVQKLAGELYGRAFFECFGLETLSLRYFNVFGSRQDPSSQYAAAIPAFIAAALDGGSPTVYGDGNQTRDFTYIDNVIHGNLLAMEVAQTHGEAVNLACGGAISVNQVIETINRLLGTDVKPRYEPVRTGDVLHSCADITLARELLGFEPTVSFEEGLRRTIEYYQQARQGGGSPGTGDA